MVSFPKPQPIQISFQIQGEHQKSSPIRQNDFTQKELETYMQALCQDCEAFQNRANYADHMLPGFHIRYDDMAKDHLSGVILPADVAYSPLNPAASFEHLVFIFTIVLSKGEADLAVRNLMFGFKTLGQNYAPIPALPYCVLMPQSGYPAHTDRMNSLYTAIRGYAMAWYLLNNVYN